VRADEGYKFKTPVRYFGQQSHAPERCHFCTWPTWVGIFVTCVCGKQVHAPPFHFSPGPQQ